MSDSSKFRHEINNNLAVIYSELQSIEEKHRILAKDQDWIMIKQDTIQLGEMINSFGKERNVSELSAASLDSGSMQEQKNNENTELTKRKTGTDFGEDFTQTIAIHPLLQSLSHSWKLRYSQKGFRLSYINQTQGTLKIKGSPSEIIQIFNNLLSNSYDALHEKLKMPSKATAEGTWFPEASLILAHHKNQIIIRLVDNGCGISRDNMAHIFEYGVTTKSTGHGIGLSVVNELVKKHRGHIYVCSVEGNGCDFHLIFPAVLSR